MFGSGAPATPAQHPFVGKYVICRCYSAGVHAGTLVQQFGDEAVLKDSRRLWDWTAKSGVALNGVAANVQLLVSPVPEVATLTSVAADIVLISV